MYVIHIAYYCDVLPEGRKIDCYGYREATAPLNAFPLQRAGRLLHNGWPKLDMSQTERRFRGNGCVIDCS
jgi:hypothetical protein